MEKFRKEEPIVKTSLPEFFTLTSDAFLGTNYAYMPSVKGNEIQFFIRATLRIKDEGKVIGEAQSDTDYYFDKNVTYDEAISICYKCLKDSFAYFETLLNVKANEYGLVYPEYKVFENEISPAIRTIVQ